jgi:hypothetical protein
VAVLGDFEENGEITGVLSEHFVDAFEIGFVVLKRIETQHNGLGRCRRFWRCGL